MVDNFNGKWSWVTAYSARMYNTYVKVIHGANPSCLELHRSMSANCRAAIVSYLGNLVSRRSSQMPPLHTTTPLRPPFSVRRIRHFCFSKGKPPSRNQVPAFPFANALNSVTTCELLLSPTSSTNTQLDSVAATRFLQQALATKDNQPPPDEPLRTTDPDTTLRFWS